MIDWGDGEYERTGGALEAAARRVADAAEIAEGMRVLDLGCGSGNAALEAARRGASVVAVDPAERLLEVVKERAREEGLAVEVKKGDASRIPADDASFDVVLSVFAVIFAPDAEQAAAEMVRVVRPGGRIAVTTWVPEGPIAEVGGLFHSTMGALSSAFSLETARPRLAWGDPAAVEALFARHGARASGERDALVFEAESPEAWFADHEEHHPAWRFVKRALVERGSAWAELRASSIAKLTAGNEDPTAFRVTSPCLVVCAERSPF
jgi:SAM-dependent methyltransferase